MPIACGFENAPLALTVRKLIRVIGAFVCLPCWQILMVHIIKYK